MKELILNIEQWAEDRNIIKGAKPLDQAMKLFAEHGEMSDHVGNNELDKVFDDVGDVFVVLTIIAKQCNLSIYNHLDTKLKHSGLKFANMLCVIKLYLTSLKLLYKKGRIPWWTPLRTILLYGL